MQCILALDTSGPVASLAIRCSDGSVISRASSHSNSHNEEIGRLCRELLDEERQRGGAPLSSLVLGRGPGSFTGLRIGFSFAKGIAHSLQIPIIAIDSLPAYTQEFLTDAPVVIAISDARREEYFWSACERRDGVTTVLRPAAIGTRSAIEQFAESCTGSVQWCGFPGESFGGLQRVCQPRAIAAGLLTLAEQWDGLIKDEVIRAVTVGELALLAPRYLRAVSAKTIEERRGSPIGS